MTRPVPEPLVCTTYRPPCAVLLEASAIGDVRVPDSASKAIVCAVGAARGDDGAGRGGRGGGAARDGDLGGGGVVGGVVRRAVIVCGPGALGTVQLLAPRGGVSVPTGAPSTTNSTRVTVALSAALTVIGTVPATVAPFAGLVIATVGRVVSIPLHVRRGSPTELGPSLYGVAANVLAQNVEPVVDCSERHGGPVGAGEELSWIELPPLSYWAESDAILTFQLRLSCTVVRRTRLWSPRSSMLLPLNDRARR